jgi:acetylornithine aminotransferase
VQVAAARGTALADTLRRAVLPGIEEVRQAGMMLGLQLSGDGRALALARTLLERGYLVLPAGTRADVIQLAPPVTISDAQLDGFVSALQTVLEAS